ncbi:MAG TPA: RNA 2',3'-cyclic phosphodiesterase [Conexibacter sp.]|nr:RNA 2',3'-cyclic phosphodiesterase [Conexibacter sp.]
MNARLFVALDLPLPVVDALVAWRTPLLRELDALRPVPRESLHVTLAFLGWKDEATVAPLAALVEGCAAEAGGVAGLALGEPLWLPRRRPRVLAVALEDRHGQLAALQGSLVERLAGGGWYEPEARPYLPHVTTARVRRGATVSGGRLAAPPALAFDGAAVVLYRSHLSSAGARYEPLSLSRLA